MTPESRSQQIEERPAAGPGRVYAFVLTLLPDPAAALGLSQQTHDELRRATGDLPNDGGCGVARELVHAYLRTRPRSGPCFDDALLADLAADAARWAERSDDEAVALRGCMAKLGGEERATIFERYAPGGSAAALAAARGLPPIVVGRRLHRARELLIGCIDQTLGSSGLDVADRHEHENANLAALRPLLTGMFDGGLNDAQWRQLRRIIGADAAARGRYIRHVALHAQLQSEVASRRSDASSGERDDAAGVADAAMPVAAGVGGRGRRRWWIATAVIAAAIGIAAWWAVTTSGADRAPPPQAPADQQVAVLDASHDVRWSAGMDPVAVGRPVLNRPLGIESGRLTLKTESGATLTVEGPARFTLRDEHRLDLRRGSAVVHVPTGADGFRVEAPGVTATAAGTELGVAVDEAGSVRVLAIDGDVEVATTDERGRATGTRRLDAGRGVALDAVNAGGLRDLRPGEAVFGRGYALSVDPPAVRAALAMAPIAYWPLNDRADAMSVADRSAGGLDGVMYGGVTLGAAGPAGEEAGGPAGAGRTSAASFDGAGYIDMGESAKLGALTGSFTVAAFAKLGPVDEVARLISVDSRVSGKRGGWGAGIRRDAKTGAIFPRFTLYSVLDYDFADTPVPPDRWMHLAFVVDERFAVTLYVDGERRRTINGKGAAVTGVFLVQIAQMAEGTERVNGSIAHVAVFDRALRGAEIASLAGRGEAASPPR